MKLFIVAAVLGVCVADRLDNKYLPPRGNQGAGHSSGFGQGTPNFSHGSSGFGAGNSGFGQASSGFGHAGSSFGHSAGGFNQGAGFAQGGYNAQSNAYSGSGRSNSADANAQILRLNSDVTAEGFSYDFETSNGIRADASGVATNGVQSHGSFGYKGDDGQDYSITYTADENGYQPQGAHLPTPPPIPEAILKSLEQNARDEAAGIVDDGTYRGEGAGSGAYSGAGGYSGSNSGYSGSNSGYSGSNAGYSAPNAAYSAASTGFNSGAGNGFNAVHSNTAGGFGQKSFGAAASRQYLAPNAGPRGSGSGNFNSQTGYRY